MLLAMDCRSVKYKPMDVQDVQTQIELLMYIAIVYIVLILHHKMVRLIH